jgi:hypothetical protein
MNFENQKPLDPYISMSYIVEVPCPTINHGLHKFHEFLRFSVVVQNRLQTQTFPEAQLMDT